ncbi:MAG: T9SS type A sorting domain-containing protein, partial [Bacteroidales bacterium]|nr:T9SS type A sorting domain-containing protein [Bacteroidales bacterium]
STDSLKVYGLAASVFESTMNRPNYVYDTSCDKAYRFLRLYLLDGDSLRWVAQKKVIPHTTPIAYYANLDTLSPPRANFITPMYELYFDSAITVIDSFAVGMYYPPNKHHYYDEDSTHYYYQYRPIGMGVTTHHKHTYFVRYLCYYGEDDNGPYAHWSHINLQQTYYLLFPILEPDTTGGGTGTGEGDDSLAVQQVQLVDRLVAVQPNPATERVKVVSSCGMERLTAYDAAGKQVYRQEASGLQATLDVSRWPAGTYILHVQTPMGTSAKRLVVTR